MGERHIGVLYRLISFGQFGFPLYGAVHGLKFGISPFRSLNRINTSIACITKIRVALAIMERQREKQLSGRIEIDDAYISGEMPGTRGRGTLNKVAIVATVEAMQDGKPLRMHLRRVRGFRRTKISRYAKSSSLAAGNTVLSGRLHCFSAVQDAHCSHIALVTGGGRKNAQLSTFK